MIKWQRKPFGTYELPVNKGFLHANGGREIPEDVFPGERFYLLGLDSPDRTEIVAVKYLPSQRKIDRVTGEEWQEILLLDYKDEIYSAQGLPEPLKTGLVKLIKKLKAKNQGRR